MNIDGPQCHMPSGIWKTRERKVKKTKNEQDVRAAQKRIDKRRSKKK